MRELFPTLTEVRIKQIAEAKTVATKKAHLEDSFENLIKEVAQLSYIHKDWLLFFRGQNSDHRNSRNSKSTFLPSIYRTKKGTLSEKERTSRFSILEGASIMLVKLLERRNILGYQDVKQRKEIQWSILQHYEVCDTPYLDLTQSLRVACSFACLKYESVGANNEKIKIKPNKGYLFVFALPYFTNRISVNSEHDLINIRLLSICPPDALRPHHQEGFLVGTTNIAEDYKLKQELDFNRRLVAKFEFHNDNTFWGKDKSSQIGKKLLYPQRDSVGEICQTIRNIKESGVFEAPIKKFNILWKGLETLITPLAPNKKSVKEKLDYFRSFHSIDVIGLKEIRNLCAFKNKLDKDLNYSNKVIWENYLLLYLLKEKIEENMTRLIAEY